MDQHPPAPGPAGHDSPLDLRQLQPHVDDPTVESVEVHDGHIWLQRTDGSRGHVGHGD